MKGVIRFFFLILILSFSIKSSKVNKDGIIISNNHERRMILDLKNSHIYFCIIFTFIFIFSQCATIIKGNHQKVTFYSMPDSAKVYIDSVLIGATPLSTEIGTDSSHKVLFKLKGYKDEVYTLKKRIDNIWYFCDIVSGALLTLSLSINEHQNTIKSSTLILLSTFIGSSSSFLLIDYITKSFYAFKENKINVELEKVE